MKTLNIAAKLTALSLFAVLPLGACVAPVGDTDSSDSDAPVAGSDEETTTLEDALSAHIYYVSPKGTGSGASAASPSNLASVEGKVVPGDTVIALPGKYASFTWNKAGAAGKPIRLRAQYDAVTVVGNKATPAAASKLSLFESSGITFEGVGYIVAQGFKFSGGNIGVDIRNGHHITVRANHFNELTSSGVVTYKGGAEETIVEKNYFTNQKLLEAGGIGMFRMDYGVRLYHGGPYYVRSNVFDGLFHHAISLKERVAHVEIVSNAFLNCGRWCIELGQSLDMVAVNAKGAPTGTPKENTSGYALVKGNAFHAVDEDSFGMGINAQNIRAVDIKDNSFAGFTTVLKVGIATSLGIVSEGEALTWANPLHPQKVTLTNNTFTGAHTKLHLGGRGRKNETVTLDGNHGPAGCSKTGLLKAPSSKPYAIDLSAVETSAAPTVIRLNGDTHCQ
jgi:hypothetical protein